MKLTVGVLLAMVLLLSTVNVYQNYVIEQQSVEIEAQSQAYVTLLVYVLKVCHK